MAAFTNWVGLRPARLIAALTHLSFLPQIRLCIGRTRLGQILALDPECVRVGGKQPCPSGTVVRLALILSVPIFSYTLS